MEKYFLAKSLVFVENFLDQGKIFARWKPPWWKKTRFLWKTCLLVQNFLDHGKMFSSRKFPCSQKTFLIKGESLFMESFLACGKRYRLWRTCLIKERKYWLVGNFFDHRKIIGPSILKIKSCNKANLNFQTIKYEFL